MYTTIGQVRNYVIAYYKKTGRRIGFPEALQNIQSSGQSQRFIKAPDSPADTLLSRKEFESYLAQIPVRIERILSNKNPMVIEENATIPLGRNLLSYVHLPYINDKIHAHNHFELNYIYAGSARQKIDGEQRILSAGEFCIFAPNMRHNVLVDDPDSLVISIPVRKSTFDSIFGRLLTQNDLLSQFFRNTLYQEKQTNYLLFKTKPDDSEIIRLIQHITVESNSDRKYAAAYVDCLIPQLFYTLLRKYSDTILYYGSDGDDPVQSNFVLMITYVQNHFTDITLTRLAKLFGYSPEHVSRLFQKNMHESFSAIVQNLKMQKAAELIRTTDLSIEDITEKVGYTSPDYFTRNFRKHFGCTPTEYRKNKVL